ncbi:MAG: hypothetical protein E7440_05980 [Ruminococcaceae bacterium]|nr:hypothetical protein [Oscillospiraceae bacterium]
MAIQLTDRASVKAVLAEMTLEEKAQIITGTTTYGTAAIPRLGIPAAMLIDNGCGVNLRQYLKELLSNGKLTSRTGIGSGPNSLSQLVNILEHLNDRDALAEDERELLEDFLTYLKKLVPSGALPTCQPVASLMASTWDPQVVRESARLAGKEASAFGVDVLLGTPGVNLLRDPRGGRGFEYYSEDPFLMTKLAPQYPLGVQEQGVLADVKHFAVNNQETNRKTVNSIVSERVLREMYFPGFKACVQEGGVKNVMTSYNAINGSFASQNKWILEDVLRKDWGFEHFVVSDWTGVYDQVAAVEAGNDLCMPGPRDITPIVEAVKNGTLAEARLDQAVENVLNALVEMPVMKGRKYTDLDAEEGRQVAYDAAAAGIILLKNENNTLPLAEDTNTAFFGPRCKKFEDSGVGSGRVMTDKTTSLLDSAASIVGEDKVTFDTVTGDTKAVVVTIFSAGQEGADREDLKLSRAAQEQFHKAADAAQSCGAKVILVLNVAGPVELDGILERADAILCVYFPGQEGARATADILYGRVNPSGKLAQTFPYHLYDCPAFGNFPGEDNVILHGEGLFVGYRHYDTRHIEPMFPFGHGLSYTTFEFDHLRMKENFCYDSEDTFEVTVRVTNTGDRAGAEVVQLYLTDEVSTQQKVLKELKGFQKVFLQPGESRDVTIVLNRESLNSFDQELGKWVCEPGWFTVRLGSSSRKILVEGRFKAVGTNPYAYGANSQYAKVMGDPRAVEIFLANVPGLTREDIKKQTAYIAWSLTVEGAFRMHLQKYFPEEQAQAALDKICCELSLLDVTETDIRYEEKQVY